MMLKLLETIRYENGKFDNLELHQERMNRSRYSIFKYTDELPLEEFLQKEIISARKKIYSGKENNHPASDSHLLKCRIIYEKEIEKVELESYSIPAIHSLKVIRNDTIDYNFKYANREPLEKLYSLKENCDDILIVKNGQVTDTSYANLLFYDGVHWITPENALLKGTRRATLLRQGLISTEPLTLSDLARFQKVRLVNAMIRFEDHLDIEINNITL